MLGWAVADASKRLAAGLWEETGLGSKMLNVDEGLPKGLPAAPLDEFGLDGAPNIPAVACAVNGLVISLSIGSIQDSEVNDKVFAGAADASVPVGAVTSLAPARKLKIGAAGKSCPSGAPSGLVRAATGDEWDLHGMPNGAPNELTLAGALDKVGLGPRVVRLVLAPAPSTRSASDLGMSLSLP